MTMPVAFIAKELAVIIFQRFQKLLHLIIRHIFGLFAPDQVTLSLVLCMVVPQFLQFPKAAQAINQLFTCVTATKRRLHLFHAATFTQPS